MPVNLAELSYINHAVHRWVTTRDPEAWRDVQSAMLTFKSSAVPQTRRRASGDMKRILDQVVDDEIAWLLQHIQGREPSGLDWALLSERIAERVRKDLYDAYVIESQSVFKEGIESAYREMRKIPVKDIRRDGAILRRLTDNEVVTTAFDGFSTDMSKQIRDTIISAYREQRVSIPEIVQDLRRTTGDFTSSRMERIARTETFKIFETARQDAYRRMQDAEGEVWMFRFGTINDPRTCKTCVKIMDAIPKDGLPLDDLHDLIVRVSRESNPNWDPLAGGGAPCPHPGCRHGTFRTQASFLAPVPVTKVA